MRSLPVKLKKFLISIYIITLSTLLLSIGYNFVPLNITSVGNILFFAILIALTETLTVPFKDVSFSTSFAVILAAFILFGPLSLILIIIIGFSLRVLKANGKYNHIFNTPLYGTLFNYCALIVPILFGNLFYKILGGETPTVNITKNLIPLMVFCFTFFILNTLIISILASIMTRKSILDCFMGYMKLMFINIIIIAPLGIILTIIIKKYGYLGGMLFIFPIVLAKYTFSLYIETKSKYIETLDVLMNAMEARDKYTQGHSKRVGELASAVAAELNYNQRKINKLYVAALLHDVGKIGIEDSILNKPGKLTEEEFAKIKDHPKIGDNILKDIKGSEWIRFIVRHHHERYDGNGYPDKKKPEELSLDVFIIQLADSVDAMSTDRPYRKALTQEQVLEEVKRNKGSQFHPDVADAYLRINLKQKKSKEVKKCLLEE